MSAAIRSAGRTGSGPPVGQGAALGVRHDLVGTPVRKLAVVVDADQPLGVRPPQHLRLLLEAGAHVGLVRPVVGEHLDRHPGLERLVLGEPHGGERARPEAAFDAVSPDAVRH
jgi:hypothetical protein